MLMTTQVSKLFVRTIAAFLAPTALLASPMLTIDTVDANIGMFTEGQASSVKHVFKVKNTGDSVLKIQSVKPG
jgi:hypothetical protein